MQLFVLNITATGAVTVNNAGTVAVAATKAGGMNHNDAYATLTVTVSPRDIGLVTVTVTGSRAYTGSQLQPAFNVADDTLAIDTGDYTNAYGTNTTVAQGGSVITFNEAYLKTLSNGTYWYVAEFSDGTSENIRLRVNKAAAQSPAPAPAPASPGSGVPQTDDGNLTALWAMLMASALGLLCLPIGYKRRRSSHGDRQQ